MRTIAAMHPSMEHLDPVAGRLAGVMLALMKGNQNEVMQITAEFDLSLTQLRTLFVLDQTDDDLAVNQIADALGISMPATTRAIDALHRTGLVSRREDVVDRRIKRIALTDIGTGAITRISDARIATVQNLVAALSDDERAALDAAATTLDDIVARHLPSHPQYCAPAGAALAAGSTPAGTESTPA